MKKTIVSLLIAAAACKAAFPAYAADLDFYRAIAADAAPVIVTGSISGEDIIFACDDGLFVQSDRDVHVIDSADLTGDMLESRTGNDLYIEVIYGVKYNNDGDGAVVNCPYPECSYISYRGVTGAMAGDTILTYCIYSTETSGTDDIEYRYDFIIDRR